MTRIRVLVVDDEPLARAGVRELAERDCELEVVGEAASGPEAVGAIRALEPELVLLDVQMPGMSGFDVIREIGADRMPAVVFITAYDRYALDAFEVNAVDYLLKPFDDPRFARTIARAKKAVRQSELTELTRRLTQLLGDAPDAPGAPVSTTMLDRIAVRKGGGTVFVRFDEIDWVEAADYYVKVHVGSDAHLVRESMAALEARLDPRRFFRVHRSALVNLDRVREVQPYFRGEHVIILADGTRLKLSRARKEKLESALRQRL